MKVFGFTVQKNGNPVKENEDAFALDEISDVFAVSDGATLGSFSQEWSQILVEGFIESPFIDFLEEWLQPLQETWHSEIDWDAPAMKRAIVRRKAERGGFATFLGLVIQGSKWQAVAVGDSCLFHIRNKAIIRAFPVERFQDFDSNPDLLCSNPENALDLAGALKFANGEFLSGDILILATDALAEWILKGKSSLKKLLKLKDQNGFERLISKLRKRKGIKNDDATMVLIGR